MKNKLIISNTRYDAILYASHLLDDSSTLITISNGMEEGNAYDLCLRALEEQRKFEVEKAYKIFGIRQLYCFNQYLDKLDYQFVLLKLQLMLTVTPYTHLIYNDENKKLANIFDSVSGKHNRIIYLKTPNGKSFTYKLDEEEIELKLNAIQRMSTIRHKLLYNNNVNEEYIRRNI